MSKYSTQFPPFPWHRCATLGAGLLFAVVFLLAWYHYSVNVVSFNSDICYCLHFCEDLIHGHDMRGWHLPAAPYLFPDMTLVAILALFTTNIGSVILTYELLYYAALLAVLVVLFQRMGISRRKAFISAALGLALMLASCFPRAYIFRSIFLFYPANHMACLLFGLGATALIARALTTGYRRFHAILLVICCGLCAFSDHLLIVQFFAPIVAAALLLALFRLVPWRRALLTTALIGMATGLAMTRESVIRSLGMIPLSVKMTFRFPGIDVLMESAKAFWGAFHDQWLMLTVLTIHMAAALSATLYWLRRLRAKGGAAPAEAADSDPCRYDAGILFVSLVLLLAPLSNAGALLITNMESYSKMSEDRYLYTWLLLPFLCVCLWPRLLAWRPAVPLASFMAIGVLCVRMVSFPDALYPDRFLSRYPPLAQALDDMVRKHGRLRGFAEYWHAREMHYLTREHVDVLPIMLWGQPRFHCFNPNAFLADDRRDVNVPDYHFIVLSTNGERGPDPERIRARYGKPVEIIRVKDFEIWRYESLISRSLDMFLRAQVAQRLVEQKPFVAPIEPPSLAKPKRNLTPCNSPDNVSIARNDTLSIRLDKPVHGAMIDIAANFSDEYTLLFRRAGRDLGEAWVSTVEWTGAEIGHYCDPGLQARLVAVPAAAREAGFDEVLVKPVGVSDHYAIGHFLVFDEWIPYHTGWGNRGEKYQRYEGEDMFPTDSSEVKTTRDDSASAGKVRQASDAFQGFLAFGPYVSMSPGRYRVDFALKTNDNSSSDTVATLDACAFGGSRQLRAHTVRGCDFASADRYQTFSLTFDLDEALDLVEYRVRVLGKAKMSLDYVDVTLLLPEKTGEACEADEGTADIWP